MIDPARLAYKPGWRFRLGGPGNTMLCVYARTPDSWNPDRQRFTQHQFQIPPEGMTPRWVLDRLLEIEQHEACEFFQVDGTRPFYPGHQGDDPYELVERQEPA